MVSHHSNTFNACYVSPLIADYDAVLISNFTKSQKSHLVKSLSTKKKSPHAKMQPCQQLLAIPHWTLQRCYVGKMKINKETKSQERIEATAETPFL